MHWPGWGSCSPAGCTPEPNVAAFGWTWSEKIGFVRLNPTLSIRCLVSGFGCQEGESLNPRMKLHEIQCRFHEFYQKRICQGTRFARTLTYTMMRMLETIGDQHAALRKQPGGWCSPPSSAIAGCIPQKPRRSGCAAGVT